MSKKVLDLNKIKLSNIGPDKILWLETPDLEDHFGSNNVIGLEVLDGVPRIIIYSDKDKEDPTHIIPLDKAVKEKV